MNPGKVLCCMFLLAVLNVAKGKRWLCEFIQLSNRSIVIMQSCTLNEHKTKDLQGQGTVFDLFDVYGHS